MRGGETRFWNYLKYIFRKSRLVLENNVYITDTCKMYFKNISKSLGQVIKEKSYHLYLKKEIELIHLKLIVFNGVKAYQLMKDIELDKIKHKKNIKEKFFPEKKPQYEVFGTWDFNKDLKMI